jgi:hypothetical protein
MRLREGFDQPLHDCLSAVEPRSAKQLIRGANVREKIIAERAAIDDAGDAEAQEQ